MTSRPGLGARRVTTGGARVASESIQKGAAEDPKFDGRLRRAIEDLRAGGVEPSEAKEAYVRAVFPGEDEPIPARMLNEFVYCPRLFYYEHVEGVFAPNADTKRGEALHARVDRGEGALPEARKSDAGTAADAQAKSGRPKSEIEEETIHSRSVTLASDRLGVIAKLDLVEVRANPSDLFSAIDVCPVDYKAGSPREGPDGVELWDTDRMQLGLQCLILRDNGYACERGIIYYRGTKQRVPLEITPDIERWIEDQISAARRCAAGNRIPAPLEDSPKCPRCSLVPICLPDETALLAAGPPPDTARPLDAIEPEGRPAAQRPVRRLLAPRDDTRALYLNTQGLRVGRTKGILQIKEKEKLVEEVRISDLTHVALFGNIQLSTQAVQALCESEVPVTYFSMGGWFYGITRGHGLKNVFSRVAQFQAAADPARCQAVARRFVSGKIRNQRTFLLRNHEDPPRDAGLRLRELAHRALAAEGLEALLGIEGSAAALYFSHFAGLIKLDDALPAEGGTAPDAKWRPGFSFEGRNRRPPRDPVNALLSLAYSLLTKDCTLAAAAVGLDPYIGFYHQPRFGRPAIALDIMEEFRPLIADSAVITAINNRMVGASDFVTAGHAVNLTQTGRKAFFQAYERRINALITHPVFDYKVTYRRAIELQFRLLARWLGGEVPEYIPFLTR